METFSRREFLKSSFAIAAAAAFAPNLAFAGKSKSGKAGRILFGACFTKKDIVRQMKSIGYDFCEGGVSDALNPDKKGDWWKKRRDELLSLPLPVRSLSGFIPGKYRLTGPNADHGPALDYAEKAVRRAAEIGVKYIVLGSGVARKVPGDKPDLAKGTAQFAEFCRKVGDRIKDIKGPVIVIEPLRKKECNIVNFVSEGKKIVEEVDSPKIRLLADIFHMMEGKESAKSIVSAGSMLLHCHVAEVSTRSFPGNHADKTAPIKQYLAALKSIGYSGGVSCECNWGKGDMGKKLETALKTLKGMI